MILTLNKRKVMSCKDSRVYHWDCKCGVMFCVSQRTRLGSPLTAVFTFFHLFYSYYDTSCCWMWQTCIPDFPENIDEDVRICSTAFNICRENTHNIFIICNNNKKHTQNKNVNVEQMGRSLKQEPIRLQLTFGHVHGVQAAQQIPNKQTVTFSSAQPVVTSEVKAQMWPVHVCDHDPIQKPAGVQTRVVMFNPERRKVTDSSTRTPQRSTPALKRSLYQHHSSDIFI